MTRPRIPIPIIDPAKCTACGRCVGACPLHLISLEPRGWVKSAVLHGAETCNGCSKCRKICPFKAIQMKSPGG